MSGKRAKALREQARRAAVKSGGTIIKSHRYKKLKKSYVNPHYAAVVVLFPTKPGLKFKGRHKRSA